MRPTNQDQEAYVLVLIKPSDRIVVCKRNTLRQFPFQPLLDLHLANYQRRLLASLDPTLQDVVANRIEVLITML